MSNPSQECFVQVTDQNDPKSPLFLGPGVGAQLPMTDVLLHPLFTGKYFILKDKYKEHRRLDMNSRSRK